MTSDPSKLTRRDFIKESAALSAAGGAAWYSMAMTTDALAQEKEKITTPVIGPGDDAIFPYMYTDPPPPEP